MSNNLQKMREKNPLVHCITNYVAMNIAANTLLAAGASPAMIHSPEETADFAKVCSALTINIGTISPLWLEGMKRAILSANDSNIPWVLDPVAHFATPYRSDITKELLNLKPTILRGNASEILGLCGGASEARGVDATDPVSAAKNAAKDLASEYNSIVVITGEVDFVTNGKNNIRVSGGSKLMPSVTAMGCSLTCLMGAFVSVAEPLSAAVSSLVLFAEAGSRADKLANGPGSFSSLFLDQLSLITTEDFDKCNWAEED